MPATARVPLGASVLNKRWYLDVDTSGTPLTPTWTPVNGVTEFKYDVATESQDDSDFDSDGWGGETNTAASWSIDTKVRRAPTKAAPSAYDPGQEFLRLKNDVLGPDGIAYVRWYEMNGATGPKVEAYEGYVSVSWTLDGGDNKGLDRASLQMKGQGKPTSITHPEAVVAAWQAATFYAVGQSVTITGGTLQAIEDGTSGGAEPTLPGTVGGTVIDGTVEWERTV